MSETELHFAVRQLRGNDVVELLKLKETNLEEKDSMGRTALHAACENENKEGVEIVQALLNAGAHINARDENESTPLHVACSAGASGIVAVLLAFRK